MTDTVQRAAGSMLGSRQQASDALSQGVASGLGGPLLMADGALRALSPRDLLALRKERLRALVRENRATLDVDDDGNPVRRDVILALALSPDTLEKAKAAGFTLTSTETIDGLDVSTSILAPRAASRCARRSRRCARSIPVAPTRSTRSTNPRTRHWRRWPARWRAAAVRQAAAPRCAWA
ncbi:hypothetical protein MOP88_16430 [Sphingomonas sp. WKB10]|nr:hypothetical protein [Sphingomonas sp. WKB10]